MLLCRHTSLNTLATNSVRPSVLCSGFNHRMAASITSCPRYHFASSPYKLNNVIKIKKHLPPVAVNSNYAYVHMPEPEYDELMSERNLTLEERYRKHPPTETEPLGTQEIPLKIIRHLRTGDAKMAQVVLAEVPDGISKNPLVAKFYDPFYFDHEQDDIDPFRTTDYQYTRETSAYQYLNNRWSETPVYYGSFTCEFPMSSGSRVVRLILVEYIRGFCMETLDPTSFSQAARQKIMENVIRADSYLYAGRFNHGDVFPRNVIVRGENRQSLEDRDLSVKLVDLASSEFGWEIVEPEIHAAISPIMRWHKNNKRRDSFMLTGWIDWDWQSWLERCFKNDPTFVPITDEQKSPWRAY